MSDTPRPPPGPAGKFDVVVIGSGPAGHKATIQAAKAGKRVVLVEREIDVGGACVHRGTIPSKTLRETALAFTEFRVKTGDVFSVTMSEDLEVASLMNRMEDVIRAHERFMSEQLRRNGALKLHGRARFVDARTVEVETVGGGRQHLAGDFIVIATGSRPRTPPDVPVDHDKILDSDSLLSMTWLPKSLTVLGAGVIASEYATIFAALGVKVTMVDKGPRPLGFLDSEVVDQFVAAFTRAGGRYVGGRKHAKVEWDGVEHVVTTLDDGSEIRSERLLCCLGRVANVDGLDLASAGLAVNDRGVIPVDEHCRTSTRSATSSARRRWRRRRWSRAAARSATRSTSCSATARRRSRPGSTPSPRCRRSASPRPRRPRSTAAAWLAARSSRSWRAARSARSRMGCSSWSPIRAASTCSASRSSAKAPAS